MQVPLSSAAAVAVLLLSSSSSSSAHADAAAGEDRPRYVLVDLTASSAMAPASTVVWEGGLGAGYLGERFEYSAQITGTSAPLVSGRRSAIGVVPRFGMHHTIGTRGLALQPYIATQVATQLRTGARLGSRVGAAIGSEVGVRLLTCDESLDEFCLGVAVGLRVTVNASDYLVGPALLPGGSAVISVPVTISFGADL